LVAKEVETVYYEGLLGPSRRPELTRLPERFLAVPHRDPQEALVLDEFGIAEPPTAGAGTGFPGRIRNAGLRRSRRLAGLAAVHLREDAAQAALGNVDGPSRRPWTYCATCATNCGWIVDHGGLAGTSRRDHLDRWYTPLNAFLSIGPPRRRIEELAALVEAGVVEVLGPRLEVRAEGRGLGGALPGRAGLGRDGDDAHRGTAAGTGPAPDRRRTPRPAAEDGPVPAAHGGRLRNGRTGRNTSARTV
jgi:hypothetical protein